MEDTVCNLLGGIVDIIVEEYFPIVFRILTQVKGLTTFVDYKFWHIQTWYLECPYTENEVVEL